MYELEVKRDFSSAHFLRGYDGKCSGLHGHNWSVEVFVRAKELDSIGISVDFVKLKKELDKILAELDHKMLNDLPAFEKMNPTSENIARHIYKTLSNALNTGNIKVHRVRIGESATSKASYFEEE